jgi:hypothetical protein
MSVLNIKIYPYYKSYPVLLLLFALFPFHLLFANDKLNRADSIILKVLKNSEFYGKYMDEYDSKVYVKGNSFVKKKNILYRYAPDFLYLDKKGKNSFIESIIDVHYKAPNFFSQEIRAVNGSKINAEDIQERVMQFLNINIYNPTLFDNQILLLGQKQAFKHYRFEYISQIDTLNYTIHQIRIIPKIRSQQLISGELFIVDGLWFILRFDIQGKRGFSKFRIETEFSLTEKNFLLPLKSKVVFNMKLLGNETVNQYYSSYEYKNIKRHEIEQNRQTNYDLSDYFSISVDSLPVIKNKAFWEKNRTIPLTTYEKSFTETDLPDNDSLTLPKKSWNFSRGLIAPKSFKLNDSQMNYSGLFNPLKLAYSKLDGIVYWQQFRWRKKYKSGQELQLRPNVGFLFQRKQVYFNTPVMWLFQPEKFGELNFNFGNKNQTYSSGIIDKINEEMPDSINFDHLNLNYFRHLKTNLKAKYEISNGLLLSAGVDYDWYTPIKSKESTVIKEEDDVDEDLVDMVENRYKKFSPGIGLRWTAEQYYRIDGKRKEYVGSRFPTISVEYTWGIKKFLESNSNFEQIEADIQQKIPIGLMSSVQYYVGAGKFLKTKTLYFANFNLFQKRNVPESWDDPIGGIFHLLDNQWYDASNSYIQGHFMYEFPCTFLRLFRGVTKDILKERLYFSQLYTPALPSYTELGYGVGNFVGNVGIFVAFNQSNYDAVGLKFSFELGK